jgi:hypothetical protein
MEFAPWVYALPPTEPPADEARDDGGWGCPI